MLRFVQKELRRWKRFASLTIYTETAVGGPEQLGKPMWMSKLRGRDAKSVAAHLVMEKPNSSSAEGKLARAVTTVSLSDWLLRVCLPRHGATTPVVMRMDVEGVEFDVLSDLATSGVGRAMELYLTLEWHATTKAQMLGLREQSHMHLLDERFLFYPIRCWDGSCKDDGPNGRQGENSTLEGSLEKTLAFMLHRAGITYVDAYFDIVSSKRPSGAAEEPGKSRRKVASPQNWTATRVRRESFDAMLGRQWAGSSVDALRPLQD